MPGRPLRPPGSVETAILAIFTCSLLAAQVPGIPGAASHGGQPPAMFRGHSSVERGSLPMPGWSEGPWPTYLGNPERTGANENESVLSASNASQLRVLWKVPLPGPPEDTPIVDAGMIYISTWEGSLSAFFLTNGTQRWNVSVGTSTFSSCYYNAARGPTATATIVNGTIYIMGGDPNFYALNASTGALLWKVSEQVNSPSSGDYNWGSPLIYGNNAYIGIASACGSPGSQGMIEEINLNGTTHAVIHTFAIVPSGQVLGGVWSTPAIDPAKNLVWVTTGDGYVGTTYGQSILALNATTLALVGHWQLGVNCCDYDFGAGPTLFHDSRNRSLVAALNKDGVVYALNRSNLTASGWSPVWTANVSWYANTSQLQAAGDFDVAPSAYGEDSLFVGGGFARLPGGVNVSGTVRSIDPLTGAFRWSATAPGIVRAGLAYANGLVIDAADDANNSGATLEVRDATTGVPLYSLPVGGSINGGASVTNGLILFGSGNWSLKGPGTLWALGLPLHARAVALPLVGGAPGTVALRVECAGGVPAYSATWQFGDGTGPATGTSVYHTYSAPGNYLVTALLSDMAGETYTAVVNVTVVDVPLSVTQFTASPTLPTAGSPLTLDVKAVGGMGWLSYAYSGLPSGCVSLNASLLTCIPNSAGPASVLVDVVDEFGEQANATIHLTVSVPFPAPLVVYAFWAEPSNLTIGNSTTLTVVAGGGLGPLSYSFGGLPPGCVSSNRSILACRPTAIGGWVITSTVTDVSGRAAMANVTLEVLEASSRQTPRLEILGFFASPSVATVGDNVTWLTFAAGGLPPYSYSYLGAPTSCLATTGPRLSCTLTTVGNESVAVTVRDMAGDESNSSASVEVRASSVENGGTVSAISWATLIVVSAASVAAGSAAILLLVRRPPRPAIRSEVLRRTKPPAKPRAREQQ